MNVYLIEDEGGVTMFDAGIKEMASGLRKVTTEMGGLKRVVLGHSHVDHRGAAPLLDAPVFCHPDARDDAEADRHIVDYSKLNPLSKVLYPRLFKRWNGGPIEIAGTVKEGEGIAGFEVVAVPGHARGMIALWRESDRLALATDAFYTLNVETSLPSKPLLAHAAFNLDPVEAAESLRKLARLKPVTAWPGHAKAVTGDVEGILMRAADEDPPGT
ncbi:MAG TPA: MBL fold metallo-hydrolase [Actinomycetota bacterium]|nr:MBL fold metallo-hydrolase [Actinomycetota bacterium]